MIALDLGVDRVEQVLRLVRALGAHRYVAGRLHLVHAFALAAIGDDAGGVLGDARRWAMEILAPGAQGASGGSLDLASRDERLTRRCSDAELAAVLEAFWGPDPRSRDARDALRARLAQHGLTVTDHAPFDESVEEHIHPLMLDAGWELLGLRELDVERHKGAIAAFGDPMAFAVAAFEEETSLPPATHLYELPAFGATELLAGAGDDGALAQPFVVWTAGNDTYLDYVFRGIQRAAKLA